MRVISWSLLGIVAAAWAVYLAYLVVAAATGVELQPSPLRTAFLSGLVAGTATAGVAMLLRRAVRRIIAELRTARSWVELGRELERTRDQPGRLVPLRPRRPHPLPTQYDR